MTNTRIVTTSIKSYQKRHHPKKHYVYLIDVLWSDGKSATIRRSYDEFFVFHCRLADRFKDHTLPIFPGRKLIGRTNTRGVAEKRLPLLQVYLRDLLSSDGDVTQSDLLRTFLSPSAADFNATEWKKAASRASLLRDDDGSDGDEVAENYLSAVVATCDYVPDATTAVEGVEEKNQLTFKDGETLYVVNVVDCPNGFWRARNAVGEIGFVPCKYVTIDPDDMKRRMSLRAVRRMSLSGPPKPKNKVLKRSYVSTECLVSSQANYTRRSRTSLKQSRRHSCVINEEVVTMSDYQMTPSSDDNSEPRSHVSTPVVVRRAEVDIPDLVKSAAPKEIPDVEKDTPDVKKSPSQLLKSDIMDIFQGLDRPFGDDDFPRKLKSFSSELVLNHTPASEVVFRTRRASGSKRKMRKSMTESLLDCRSIGSSSSMRGIDTLGLIHEVKIFVSANDDGDEVEGEAYKAVQKYKPIDQTGLPIVKGDMLVVTLKLDDGWWCGRSCSSGQSGWFPSWVAKRA